ncbi:uncharacterized protein PHALS_14636 [Plasmopara halstedii]|uniref:Uncharacterized protein n=1 Tax=Plasmopara halstedii TaxID=4781 RepID=A0A0P1ANB0_PLAHL|nr:uncharacterized protein PHALS_14636 [Plasmopara halstedii]CEG42533.1 hypothetical protein PHALS_14636 [Plasmopara halstedii]|eukprot:XP_024578902.1 hypothetical protein PHALS_14636 [Plasmopara halstedii]
MRVTSSFTDNHCANFDGVFCLKSTNHAGKHTPPVFFTSIKSCFNQCHSAHQFFATENHVVNKHHHVEPRLIDSS